MTLFLSLPMGAWLPLISTITIVACLLPVGNISDNLDVVGTADWVVEAVV